jgi:hypothetical protein
MAEAVETAIQMALVLRAQQFAAAQSPALTIALPNIAFTPPNATPTAKYLRATFLPADTFSPGVSYASKNEHRGLLQVDVFYGFGGGEASPRRIADAIIAYFKRGTKVTKDGFTAEVILAPYCGPIVKDIEGPWMMIPVRIPYLCIAPNPA